MSSSNTLLRDLRTKADVQREVIAIQKRNIKEQQEKLSLIENTIQILSSERNSSEFLIPSISGSADSDDDDSEGGKKDSDDDSESPLLDAIWDQAEDVFRCTVCTWEVVDGFCQACMMEFKWNEAETQRLQQAVSTYSDALNSDRSRIPRGTTPLFDINPSACAPSSGYHNRAEFRALLQRGATRLMCETFHLSFSQKDGIIAWADDDIYEQFSGPAMLKGDFWKIHLGRRIELDEDDLDGSMFIEGLLEDVLFYPPEWSTTQKYLNERWETVEENPGIWITRLMTARNMDDSDGESERSDAEGFEKRASELWDPGERYQQLLDASPTPDTGPIITLDEYELSDEEEEEAEEGSDVEMMDDSGWTWKAGVPDAVWAPELDEDEEVVSDDDMSDSSDLDVESDFESDAVFTGDEEEVW